MCRSFLFVIYHSLPLYKNSTLPLLTACPLLFLIGWFDDRMELSPKLRLLMQLTISLMILALSSKAFSQQSSFLFLPNHFLLNMTFGLLYVTWFVNLYNFMDGIDGMAAGNGICGAVALSFLAAIFGYWPLSTLYFILSCCVGGVFFYNWQPAKIFMGDSGAYFLGGFFAIASIMGQFEFAMKLYPTVIVFGFFIVDTTWTLIVRVLRKQNPLRPHTEFLFHKLVAQGRSHSEVSRFYIFVMIFWLFPFSYCAMRWPMAEIYWLMLAYFPLVVVCILKGAGRPEKSRPSS